MPDRFQAAIAAVILLLIAWSMHKGSKGWMKWGSLVAAAAGSCAIIATIFGRWMIALGGWLGLIVAALLLFVVFLLIRDLWDRKPEKTALWCAALLPLLVVLGAAQVPGVFDLISDGAKQATTNLSRMGG